MLSLGKNTPGRSSAWKVGEGDYATAISDRNKNHCILRDECLCNADALDGEHVGTSMNLAPVPSVSRTTAGPAGKHSRSVIRLPSIRDVPVTPHCTIHG